MEIKTKFDVGQEVWPILIDGVVADFHYRIVAQLGEQYRLFGGSEWYAQSDLFATQAEAQAECDRRNGEGV